MSKDFRERFDVKLRYLDCPYCEGVPDLMELYLLQPITLEKAGEKLPVCTRLGGFRFACQEVVIRVFRVELLDDVQNKKQKLKIMKKGGVKTSEDGEIINDCFLLNEYKRLFWREK